TLGATRITELREGGLTSYDLKPEDVGLKRAAGPEEIQGGTPEENAKLVVRILEGEDGPARDIVVLNAAAAIAAGGLANSLAEAVPVAVNSIDSGAALGTLRQLQAF
ncbi:MAG TPA: anthranilate phosphoribosyltransferase, partial [Armatimonadota bacterium]|nr:anthranilate phosphoribosyltransferase [Armatimonadota bacterium]